MTMSGMGMIARAVSYLVPLISIIVTLVKVTESPRTKRKFCHVPGFTPRHFINFIISNVDRPACSRRLS